MINAVHAVIYTKDAEALRAFFRDVLGFPSVDAGYGWLIFALPPAELGIHPADEGAHHQLYLMCDDIEKTVAELKSKGVEFTQPVKNPGWGLLTALRMPDGEELYLYEPKHSSPLSPAQLE
jgi:predicted enzyme related to lactoylglutathione lyase